MVTSTPIWNMGSYVGESLTKLKIFLKFKKEQSEIM